MRSFWKFLFYDKHILKKTINLTQIFNIINIRSRRSSSFLINIDYEVNIFNGKEYVLANIPFINNIKKYPLLGEFVFTKKRSKTIHRFNAIYRKDLKKKAMFFKKKKQRLRTLSSKKNRI